MYRWGPDLFSERGEGEERKRSGRQIREETVIGGYEEGVDVAMLSHCIQIPHTDLKCCKTGSATSCLMNILMKQRFLELSKLKYCNKKTV